MVHGYQVGERIGLHLSAAPASFSSSALLVVVVLAIYRRHLNAARRSVAKGSLNSDHLDRDVDVAACGVRVCQASRNTEDTMRRFRVDLGVNGHISRERGPLLARDELDRREKARRPASGLHVAAPMVPPPARAYRRCGRRSCVVRSRCRTSIRWPEEKFRLTGVAPLTVSCEQLPIVLDGHVAEVVS